MVTIKCESKVEPIIRKEIEDLVNGYLRKEKSMADIVVGLKASGLTIEYVSFLDRRLPSLKQDQLRKLLQPFY